MSQHIVNNSDAVAARALSPQDPPQATFRPYALQHLDAAPAVLADNVLACIHHGEGRAQHNDPRNIHVDLPVLAGHSVELWTSERPVRCGRDGSIDYAENGAVLFGHLHLLEHELADIDRAVFHAYARIDHCLQQHGYPAWLRVWNYLADITGGGGDAERYRQFSVGRYKALSLKPGFEHELPAATAIGTHGDGLLIYFLAGKRAGTQIENPRQVSAFRYPRQYGPKSPSFSRANLLRWDDASELMVSGTASIVGHETLHIGEPLAQLDEALANVDALLAQTMIPALQPQLIKLYLRHRGHFERVAAHLAARYMNIPCMVLQGDVCRDELDVEIEAIFQAPT